MSENINDGTSDNPTAHQLENPSGDNISATENDTIIPNQETENMEVHKHPHHVTHKKKWGEYLLEFFMLFLAVFLGFVAENIREHVVEHDRSKEYAISLVQDLANDTTEILDVIKEDKIILTCFDSISSIIQRPVQNHLVPGSFYYYSTLASISPSVTWNNSTLTQITQSGNVRYFRNPEVLKKISLYYSNSDYISRLNLSDRNYRDISNELRNKILNNKSFKQYSYYNNSTWLNVPDSIMKKQLAVQSYESAILNEFANSFESRKIALGFAFNNAYPKALKTAKELIELLKLEYGLK